MIARSLVTLGLLFAVGCGAALPDAAAARERANGLRTELNVIGDDVRDLYVSARALCELDVPEVREPCSALEMAGPRINDGFDAAALVIDGAELGAATFEQARSALDVARELAAEALRLAEGVRANVAP